MITPTRQLVLLFIVPCAATLLLVVGMDWLPIVLAADAAVVGVAVFDMYSVPRRKRLRARRECGSVCSLDEPHRVVIELQNRSRRPLRLDVRDDRLPHFEVTPETLHPTIPAKSRARVHYTLTPMRRGTYQLDSVYVRVCSRMGLWSRIYKIPCQTVLRVYPDLKQISRYGVYARLNRLSLLGVRRTRRVGADNEFERLRDYTNDDNYKYIDWRATGRRRKLVVRDYQRNHNQRIMFLIDCGRMMMNEAVGLSLLDHAFNAMLMMAHVAMTQGDQVGLVVFSSHLHQWVPLGTGGRHHNRLVHAVHDVYPNLVESRFDRAFLHLNIHCRKRTLVVLITNVIDQVNADQIEAQMSNLAGRHLPLGVLLRDHGLFDVARPYMGKKQRRFAGSNADLYRAAAAADIIDWRAQVMQGLHHKGVLTLDVYPENLTAPLINEYLSIKARHLL